MFVKSRALHYNKTMPIRVMISEKRAFSRIPCSCPVEISAGTSLFYAHAVDVSGEGAGIKGPRRLRRGQEVCLRFSPSAGKTFLMRGMVIWARETSDSAWNAGVRLADPSLFSLSQIAAA